MTVKATISRPMAGKIREACGEGHRMAEVPPLWPAQAEAVEFALARPAAMLDMGMGCGKTRVAIEVMGARPDVRRALVVCPKAVIPVWGRELAKYADGRVSYEVLGRGRETVAKFAERVPDFLNRTLPIARDERGPLAVVVCNYDSVWRRPLGDLLCRVAEAGLLDMVILDESHRAKAAGSKVSKYLAMLGRRVRYRLCLSGTPMANSPLDVYGQYRFLDRSIFGTNHERFLQTYAVMGGPDRNFIVGYKNQRDLMDRFRSIAYTCSLEDVADRAKLPDALPDQVLPVSLPARDMRALRDLQRDFVAECGGGFATASNVLVRLLRMQQITSGFCEVQPGPGEAGELRELNAAKYDAALDWARDLPPTDRLVVFCTFTHDLDASRRLSEALGRPFFELSGREHRADEWGASEGGLLAVQIQAGAEGVDLTASSRALYWSLPHSLALYEQSRARIRRPGQSRPAQFVHLVAEGTVDEGVYASLRAKRDVIDAVRAGEFDFGYMRK